MHKNSILIKIIIFVLFVKTVEFSTSYPNIGPSFQNIGASQNNYPQPSQEELEKMFKDEEEYQKRKANERTENK